MKKAGNEKRNCGTAQKRQTPFGRAFIPPSSFAIHGLAYYKKLSYQDVLIELDKDIDRGLYRPTIKADHMKKPAPSSSAGLDEMLSELIPLCPNLFSSDNTIARKLTAHFGRMVWEHHTARNNETREILRKRIAGILFGRLPVSKNTKKPIPIFLSLSGLYDYLHKITEHLKQRFLSKYANTDTGPDCLREAMADLKSLDPRLFELAKYPRYMELLTARRPARLTCTIIAAHFGFTEKGMNQYLKEERAHLKRIEGKKRKAVLTP